MPLLSYNYFNSSAGPRLIDEPVTGNRRENRGRFSSAFRFSWSHNVSDNQWYGNYTDSLDVMHYTFAHLDQYTTSATVRLNYTFTPNVSLQAYMQPFVSKGTYTTCASSRPRRARRATTTGTPRTTTRR